ncbi:MAG TPA: long-chain fatty acid--CoA ligase [Mycobacterium sp.]|nr:long-chain fatty acid--CoA ligase [Mycobacterium sp.]
MLSTMQDAPLSIGKLLRYGSTVHSGARVITWTENGPRSASYAEVGRRCARLAHALRGLGVTGDQRVGTFMWNNQEHLEAYLAVPAMGAVLHTLNIRLFPEQLVQVINHAEDLVILVDASLVSQLALQLPKCTTVRHIVVAGSQIPDIAVPEGVTVHSWEQLIADHPDQFDWPEVDERSAAAMCYTSGTTGDPKGVVYSHRSIWLHSMQVCMTETIPLKQGDLALLIVPQFHAMSWGTPYAAFMIGASLLMPDHFLQPAPLAEMIETLRPNVCAAVPAIWQGLVQYLEDHEADISSLELATFGGSAAPPSLMRTVTDRYGITTVQGYGMTETSPVVSVSHPPAGISGDEAWQYRYTQGRLFAAVEARLVDADGNVVPNDGESVGELELKGPWITGSYYGIDTPDSFDHGWLRTGDVGKITPDGYLTLTDRAKDIIKSGGEWISSTELENLVMAHPEVLEAAVIGIPDQKWSERPLVFTVLREGSQVTFKELQEFMAGRIARWQLPENWVRISEVPKTSVGKFDKKRLRARFQDGTLDIERI